MEGLLLRELEKERLEGFRREAERCHLVSRALAAREAQRRERTAVAMIPRWRAILVASLATLHLGH